MPRKRASGKILKATLIREIMRPDVTLGEIKFEDGGYEAQTLELPWEDNAPYVSCIPEGTYTCKRDFYNRGGYECFEVTNVPNRTDIKIHIGNYIHNFLGCIGLGTARDVKRPAIWHSKKAFDAFMDYLKGVDEFELTIVNKPTNK